MENKMETEIEKGQIYIIKPNAKLEGFPENHKVRIEGYFNEAEDKHNLKGVWLISVKDDGGDWIKPENNKDIIFTQQLEAHFKLEYTPMAQKTSRLSGIDD